MAIPMVVHVTLRAQPVSDTVRHPFQCTLRRGISTLRLSGVYVRDLTSYVVKTVRECDKLRDFGAKNRHVGATAMNQAPACPLRFSHVVGLGGSALHALIYRALSAAVLGPHLITLPCSLIVRDLSRPVHNYRSVTPLLHR